MIVITGSAGFIGSCLVSKFNSEYDNKLDFNVIGCHSANCISINENELIELLIQVKSNFPEECRINRLIRDIPDSYVLGGIKDSSGRQRIENIMKERN